MAEKPIQTPLPADLPEDWNIDQIVAPDGTTVGLTEQHGYNYLMASVNRAQRGVNVINDAFETVSGKRTCRFVVGTSTAGWTAADCDFLCDGVDDQEEINMAVKVSSSSAAQYKGGEVVLLDGTYCLTDQVAVGKGVLLRGNGKGTILSRRTVSVSNSENTKDAIISLASGCELRDLMVDTWVDAPDAVQIFMGFEAIVSGVGINIVNGIFDEYGTGIGIYSNASIIRGRINNCFFGNVSTAIYVEEGNGFTISGCSTISAYGNSNVYQHVPCFVYVEKLASQLLICGNRAMGSIIHVNSSGCGALIVNNIVQQIEITNTEPIGYRQWEFGNIIANNSLGSYEGEIKISLGENTTGWFVTGNQIKRMNMTDAFWPIIDNGIDNIVRFNSDDAGGNGSSTAGVTTFNGRSGRVSPASGDYTAAMVGAIPASTVQDIQAITQAAYDALTTQSPSTLYLIKE